jgi:hypothetical protein
MIRRASLLPLALLAVVGAGPATATPPHVDAMQDDDALPLETVTVLVDGEVHRIEDAWLQDGQLWLPADRAPLVHGLEATADGLRRGDFVLATPPESGLVARRDGRAWVNASRVALALRQALVAAADERVWSFAQPIRFRTDLAETLVAPDVTLPDRTGKPVNLADMRGKKVLLLTWASW